MAKPEIPCLVCGETMDLHETKPPRRNPMLVCLGCAVQVFVRGRAGVKMFEKKYGMDWRTAPADPNPPLPGPGPVPEPTPAPAPKTKEPADAGRRLW
jgi:hypothetical protein